MSTCERCGATFHCAMADAAAGAEPSGAPGETPCWCTLLPPAVPVPQAGQAVGCWCPDCLRAHLATLDDGGHAGH